MPDADPHDQALAAVLPPALRELIRGHALTLGRPVWGQRAGRHRAARAGLGQLFRAHRPYVPGDDPRLLDWRAMARRDRPVLRQTEGEDELALVLLADVSGACPMEKVTRTRCGRAPASSPRSRSWRSARAIGSASQAAASGRSTGAPPARRRHAPPPRDRRRARPSDRGPAGGDLPLARAGRRGRAPPPAALAGHRRLRPPRPLRRRRGGRGRALAELRRSPGARPRRRPPPGAPPRRARAPLGRRRAPPGARSRGSAPLEGRAATLLRGYQERLQAHLDGIDAAAEAAGIHVARVISDEPLAAAFLDLLARLAGAPAPAATAISP
ncbi:MAG: DUF58 domain-containing protein [Myxococcales bacterium]|nr:DUF58 domain-containing protein [Myxococcales bacterium]